jgi:hypothetical protein
MKSGCPVNLGLVGLLHVISCCQVRSGFFMSYHVISG